MLSVGGGPPPVSYIITYIPVETPGSGDLGSPDFRV